jgi:hypothetical protein
MRLMFLKEHSINSLQSYMYAFQMAGCRAEIGWVQAAGSKRQKKRRYLRHQLVVAAAQSHVLSRHSRVALALFHLETFSQSAGIADCGTEKQQAIVALAFFGSRTPARYPPTPRRNGFRGRDAASESAYWSNLES